MAGVIAQDDFSTPPYTPGGIAGQTAGGSGFTGSWAHDTGLILDLQVNAGGGSVGRPTSLAYTNGGDYESFASPISLATGQLFFRYSIVNVGGNKLNSTRMDLNFANSAPFTGDRALFGGLGKSTGTFDFWMESGVCPTCGAPTETSVPDDVSGINYVVGVLDVTNNQAAMFVNPTSSSFYHADGTNNADAVSAWVPASGLNLYSYSLIENTGDAVNFGNVLFATDAASVGLGGASPVPEPSTMVPLGILALGLAYWRFRSRGIR